MALKLRFYRCNTCGNIVQVFIDGVGELVCCGHEMELLEPKSVDEGLEKHVPVIEKHNNCVTYIKIGSEPHPMIKEHYIQFIEALSKDKNKFLVEFFEPNMPALMRTNFDIDNVFEYCNIHGLWEGNND